MKANELLVGDWILFNGIPYRIIKTGFYDVYLYLDDEGKWVERMDIEPIPLTEEILIKNGFSEDAWHGSFPEDKDGLLYIVLSFNKIFWEINDCRIEIKSVHQLQHIIRDLEIEKEIEL